MSEKIMMDGEPLEVGDRVYCLKRGDGTILRLEETGIYPIICLFDNDVCDAYNNDFKREWKNLGRSLYWQKPEITPPPKLKPKNKIKVWDWYVEGCFNYVRRYSKCTLEFLQDQHPRAAKIQKIDGTEREIEVEE